MKRYEVSEAFVDSIPGSVGKEIDADNFGGFMIQCMAHDITWKNIVDNYTAILYKKGGIQNPSRSRQEKEGRKNHLLHGKSHVQHLL